MNENQAPTPEMIKMGERIARVETAVALGKPDRVPVTPLFSSVVQRLYGSSYKDIYYDHRKAGEAALKFYQDYPQCDVHFFAGFTSGRANELAGTDMIDWPGRPGTIVSDYSSHQVIEREYLLPEEYPEFLGDFTGFMLRKYLPRAYPNLAGLADIRLTPTVVLSTSLLAPMYSEKALSAYALLGEIAKADGETAAVSGEFQGRLAQMGFPPLITGIAQAPYDILGDYFRGTMGMFFDLMEREDEIEAACWMFADQQIQALQYFKYVPLPVKRVFFPLHKGMDGFMNPRQYERLYWKPLKKIMMALIDMGVTPLIYTEGNYDSRVEQLMDVPKGKVIYHFETVDMARAKRLLGDIACISGNLPISVVEFGTKEQVADGVKRLLDTCAPGGGYLFDFNGGLENAPRENLDAMFETLELYGKY